MGEHAGDRHRGPNRQATDMNGASPHEGLSLKGEEGRQVAVNLARLALGQISIKDLNDPRYSLTPDGAVSLDLDDDSIAALETAGQR